VPDGCATALPTNSQLLMNRDITHFVQNINPFIQTSSDCATLIFAF
jgi:uncharacterized membrane protein (UPF0182 family)